MLIDAQGVRHLQLLSVQRGFETVNEGSLFYLLDNTRTAFSKRLLRRWICSPLTSIQAIEKRQQAIEDLMRVPETVRSFQRYIDHLPDIERLLASIYQQSIGSSKGYNENIPLERLKDFYKLIDRLKEAKQAIGVFTHVREEFKSQHLRRIVTYDSETKNAAKEDKGLFPDIDTAVSEFEALI